MTAKKVKEIIQHKNGDILKMGFISTKKLTPNKFNIQMFGPQNTEAQQNTKSSIINNGVLDPIAIDQTNRIIDGENRWRYSQKYGIDKVPYIQYYVENDEGLKYLMGTLQLCRRSLSDKDTRRILQENCGAIYKKKINQVIEIRKQGKDLRSLRYQDDYDSSEIKKLADMAGVTDQTIINHINAEVNEILKNEKTSKEIKESIQKGKNLAILNTFRHQMVRHFNALPFLSQETVKTFCFLLSEYLREGKKIQEEFKNRK